MISNLESYPQAPGYKATDTETSRQAAESVKPGISRLRRLCLEALRERGPMTADEVAEAVGECVLSVRPAVSGLKAMGEVVESVVDGRRQRRKNASGRNAVVWTLRPTRLEQGELL